MILAVALIGMVVIASCAFIGRRRPSATLEDWTVGQRNFGGIVTWFLMAGESFTTFTFLAVAGLAFTSGAAATYAIPYIPLSFIGLYFLGPKLWRLGKQHGYLTQADFFSERYRSPLLGRIVAVVGVVFLLPYLQLQITGLGLIVELVTGSHQSGTLSMVVATVLMVAFVLWSGIRGLAQTAYLKDALMILAMIVLIIAVPVHYAGGIGALFRTVSAHEPQLLTLHSGPTDGIWWVSSVLISTIGSLFMTLPHLWPGLLAARGPRTLRRNFTFLPLYQVVIILPVIIGFTGVVALKKSTDGNDVLLTLAHGALPDWLTGVIAVAAAASAMIPAAALCIGMSTLVAHNLLPTRTERTRLAINHGTVLVAAGLALTLGLTRPNALANLLLLTFSGLAQLAPALAAAVGRRRWLNATPALLGIVVGVGVVGLLTFDTAIPTHNVNVGIIGLVANVVVAAAAQAVVILRSGSVQDATRKAEASEVLA
ncbi:sodium:solute symporter family protein [Leekyejoonella antrihumi]|uniref:Sodium:solute symporter family protein n=1 Tax=Leekyejoonella antrihumi TaxID=1660198 RepID=A0A563DV55_9MICO|nr:sodium:solute symporter family protein [Leekyejoonella antrihumi]TWP33802.1 sodium:solute symporter family protein [Leekyejoonella antrihumi]